MFQVFFVLELKPVSWLVCYYFNFFCFYSQKVYCFSMTHTSISRLFRPGKWNYKLIPWLSRFSMTRAKPRPVFNRVYQYSSSGTCFLKRNSSSEFFFNAQISVKNAGSFINIEILLLGKVSSCKRYKPVLARLARLAKPRRGCHF